MNKPIVLGKYPDGSDDYGDVMIFTCGMCKEPRHYQFPSLIKSCTLPHDYDGHCHHYDPWNK